MATGTNTENQNMAFSVESMIVSGVAQSAAEMNVLAGVTAGTVSASKALVADSAKGISGFRNTSSVMIFKQVAETTKTTAVTLTAAELLTGIIKGTPAGAGVAYTLPLATDLETALIALYPGLAVDDAFEFSVVNIDTTATNTIVVTTNTGWTLVGNMILGGNSATANNSGSIGVFRARRTAANTYTLYRVG